MEVPKPPLVAMRRTMHLLGGGTPDDLAIRQAAWVARCVGRGHAAPLTADDLTAIAANIRTIRYPEGGAIFHGGTASPGVWIVRSGRVELSVGSGRKRAIVHMVGPGDVDGDIQHLLEMPMPYTARAVTDVVALFLDTRSFETILATRPAVARRWLSSVAMRVVASQNRIIGMLGHSLTEQVARLLLEEAVDGSVALPQRTLAAMLGAQRPSLNKIIKDLERRGLVAVRYAAIDIRDARGLVKLTR